MTTFRVKISNGRIVSKVLDHYIRENEGRDMFIKVDVDKPSRSTLQNNLYWLYLGTIAASTGNTKDDLHCYFKSTLLPKKKITIRLRDGSTKIIEVEPSTRDLNKQEFSEYLEKIEKLTGVPIPDTTDFI